MRQFKHIWCHTENGDQLVTRPRLLRADDECTLSNMWLRASEDYGSMAAMKTRPLLSEVMEGKKTFWRKGDAVVTSYSQAYEATESAARGLVQVLRHPPHLPSPQRRCPPLLTARPFSPGCYSSLACGRKSTRGTTARAALEARRRVRRRVRSGAPRGRPAVRLAPDGTVMLRTPSLRRC